MTKRSRFLNHMPWKTEGVNDMMIRHNRCTCTACNHYDPDTCIKALAGSGCRCCTSSLSWVELQDMAEEFEKEKVK